MCAMRNIRVVDHDPAWTGAFEREAAVLAAIFGEELITVHHIGSTSVPGLRAKPVVDMLPIVRDIARVDLFNPAMADVGYLAWGEYGIPGRRYFTKGGDEQRTHNVHFFGAGSPEIARHLAFRDYLRAHADVAAVYAELKAGLAVQFPDDINAYNDGKDAFIKEMEKVALAWQAG